MIILKNVKKVIKGETILDDINLELQKGVIYGLSGRNGSGKTMLLRAICGLLLPTEGSIEIDGQTLHKDISFAPNTGIIIESMQMTPQLTGFQNLKALSKIKKIATDDDINNALVSVGLEKNRNQKVKKYSLGMKQRLNIAQAIFEKPDLLLLDEPLNAIDQEGVELIRKLLIEEKERGCIVVIASHLSEDLDILCDKKILIDKGVISNG